MANKQEESKYEIVNPDTISFFLDLKEEHLRMLEDAFSTEIFALGQEITVKGPDHMLVFKLIQTIDELIGAGHTLSSSDLANGIQLTKENKLSFFESLFDQPIGKTFSGEELRAKTEGQLAYVRAIESHAVTLGLGPAGTGKTFLAVVLAVQALKKGQVKRIIVTRPAVEAGESLGFLPGDLKEKVDPYLRPIYDAFYSICGTEYTERLLERNVIEIAPLAYMRGRTLDDAFVILDEAQNTTVAQMKMFLTRLGFGSKMLVNGDVSQIDLPRGVKSGLVDAREKLKNISDIAIIQFTAEDVIRHPVVAAIIKAYGD